MFHFNESLCFKSIYSFNISDIVKGDVMIGYNNQMCYINTVNWNEIINTKGGYGIYYNHTAIENSSEKFWENDYKRDCSDGRIKQASLGIWYPM